MEALCAHPLLRLSKPVHDALFDHVGIRSFREMKQLSTDTIDLVFASLPDVQGFEKLARSGEKDRLLSFVRDYANASNA
jgi:hypothetical protein